MEVKCTLLETPGKATIVVGRQSIEIEPRVIYRTNTDALRVFLEKQCAGLTSNQPNGDLTVDESLVLSLVQHYTSRYWHKSLDYASLSVISGLDWLDESTWNKFRATLDLSETITTNQVGELWGRFHRLWFQQLSKTSHLQIICFGFDEGSRALKLSLSSSHPTTTYYLWHDKIRKCFDGIACLSEFYQDTASYWEHLVLLVENCLDQFFKDTFAALSEEALGNRYDQLNDEIKLIDNTFDSFKQQFRKWKIGDEFHHIVLDMENCILSPDQDSKDSTSVWCDQLWQVTARCLARQIEQAFIDQKRKIEMKRRETNKEIDKILENVERLNSEIAKCRQRIDNIDRRAAEELKLLEKLAWKKMLLDLANPAFVPDYNLACQRRNHEIYRERNASLLAVMVFDLMHPPPTADREQRAMIENYVKRESNKLQELHSALDKFIGREISNGITNNRVLTIDGEASVVLSKIVKSSVNLSNCREIVIKAERVIYLDCDWKVPGISVTLTAPLIHVCSPGVGKCWTIDTSGRDGKEHEHLKADDGNGAGGSGNHGLAGEDGEDAGNVNICCQDFKGFLKIVARGGKGTDGQDGGNGKPGSDGYDGRDGTTPCNRKLGKNWYTLGDLRGITERVYFNNGWPGKRGGDGGSGGNGGKGGQGGLSGQVKFVSSHHRSTDSSQFIQQDCTRGEDGNNGHPGHGAAGGSGGKHGKDAFLYFEPNDNRPYIWNTGYWRSHMGSITDLEMVKFWGEIIGHKIRSSSSRRNQATEGKRGTEGQKAACQQQRQRSSNATTHQTASQFHSHHQTGSDEYERERNRQAEARRRDEREKEKERDSINQMSREVVGERKAVSRHEGALAADRQRLERMDEIHQRVQAKIQETFEQRIAQQTVVGQRITRQMKLNFEDENILGLPASRIPTNLVSNVRSGRPVCEKSTAALRCSAQVDALVMSLMMSKGDDSFLLTLKIPQAFQSLVLKLKFDEHEKEWESIEKIVSEVSKTSHPLKLADSLEFIASHLPLIISLADQVSPARCDLIEILLAFLASTGHHEVAEKNAIWILHEFHQRPIPVQQVIAFLGRQISDWTHQPFYDCHIILGLFLDKWILTNITKTIFGVTINQELRQSRASLFAQVWLQCSPVSKWTKSAAPSSDAENDWLKHVDQFVSGLSKALNYENSIAAVDKLLLPFARDRLGIAHEISKIDVKDRWQRVFIIDHMSPEVDEMDAIGQWARKNCDCHLMALVERAFSERFVAPIWSQMQSLFSEKWSTDGKMNEDVGEAIRRLKTAIQSSFTSLSFKERLQLGRTLKEKLDGADKKPRQFLDCIKPLSQKVEASTADLFVSSKNDTRHEVEIILSLLADSKKFQKKNVILELHFRLSHLTASFEPSQIEEVAGILFNKSPITDHFIRYHWHCFRSTFLEKWSNYFFLRWSKCNEQTEHFRNVIARRNPEDDDRSLNSLELALERYLLFTTGLPPLEAVQKWLQLQKQSSPQDIVKFIAEYLKLAVKEIALTITPRVTQLYSNKLLCITTKGKHVGKDIVVLTDILFEIISGATVPFFDDAESVRSLLVVIEAAQLMMDLITDDDAKNTSSQLINSAKLGKWKKKLVQWKVLDSEAQSMVHFAVKELVETAESKSSSENVCSREIYDQMTARRRNMLHTFNQALSWLEMFVGYLAGSRSGIDTLTVIKATIASSQCLSWNGLKNEKTSLLRAAIDIFVECTSIPNLSEISWSSFFDAILNLDISEKPIGLITTLANFVGLQLSSDRKRATWDMARDWVLRLDYLFTHTRKMHDASRAADGQNTEYWTETMGIQQVLFDYCSACYETKLLANCTKCPTKKVDLDLVRFTFKNFVDRWTNIVRFVRPNMRQKTASNREGSQTKFLIDQVETRQLVLKGLIQLGQSNSFYWDEKTANHFLNGCLIPELDPSPGKKSFLSKMLSGTRKAFHERCVGLEDCLGPGSIGLLEEALRNKTNSLNDAQLFFSITSYDIFNDEEKLYIDLIDDRPSVESALLVDDQQPSCFLGALQKLAIERFRAEFVRCFEPSITDQDIERYLPKSNQNGAPHSQEALADKQHIIQLCRSFNQLISTKIEQGADEVHDWLLWIRDVIVPSLKSYEANQGLSVHQITKFFEEVEEFPLDLCRAATTSCRPHQWIDMLAIFAIQNLLDELNEKCREDEIDIKSSGIVQQLVQWWPSSGAPGTFLHTFYHKIRQEMAGDPIRLMKLVQEVTNRLTALKLQFHEDVTLMDSFSNSSLNDWLSVIRYAQLAIDWTPDIARRLVSILDVQFGQKRSDHFLRLVVHRHPELKDKSGDHAHLRNILQNLFRYPSIKDRWFALIDESLLKNSMAVKDSVWNSLFDADIIEKDMRKSSQADLSVEDIFSIMSRDPESSKVIGNCSEMVERIKSIRIRKFETKFDIRKWSNEIKKPSSKSLQVDDFLAVACRVVHDKNGYFPRDVQLIAVTAFVSSDDNRQAGHMIRRMGQISTGEGKTLISALVAIYHTLRYWNKDRHVNIITSSSVLAEANIAEIGWLFQAFDVSVSNNCDQLCSNDDDIRRNRYNNDVIYGDLGSFMRDILLTRFFEDKDMTRNRNPGAIIVDEVDSMTLDKGENILYMSHNIPEMYDLMRLFVQIWTMVNAPDVVRLAESSDIVDEVRQLIEPMIPTCVPNCLKQFAERHLSTWIKSAFRACYLLKPNDAYKVDDCCDGQGRRIVIMDKETGVEQVQTEWSDGLQQFLQLKHGLKWTPISLKAIFMSNIGYFSEFEGRMYGLTGTLGSAAECDLLGKVFGVDFFRLPRFRPRFCLQHEPIIAHDRQNWLDQMQQAVVSVASNQKRAVLVVCENIESANSIYDRLKTAKTVTPIQVVKYVSSFDEAFKENQHQEILPGQVIIATNLAGRGTDLKPSKVLLNNGGLHVIIGFLPPNSRVEAQAEGRTARSGQPGSYQFVIENEDEEHRKSHLSFDPYGQILQLKSKRDEDERLRLDNIRREALPKIQLEEKLFHKFYEKCVRPLNQTLIDPPQQQDVVQQILTKVLDILSSNQKDYNLNKDCKRITRNCFNNRWALWLDENAGSIEKAHRDPVLDDRLSDSFDHLTMSVKLSDVESVVSSPSEWTMLARCYEESSHPRDAVRCYNQVTTIEPKWCENALLDLARLALADDAGYEKKREAKSYLKRARKLIDDRIDVLTSLNQQIDQCLNTQMENGSSLCHRRFEEQVTNQIRLWGIHASEINNLLGVSLKCALASILPTENDQHIDQVIELLEGCHFMKPRHYRKTGENSFDWPPFVAHCREPLLDLVKKKNCKLSDIENAIGKVETKLWSSLISVYIDEGQIAGGGKMIKADHHVGEIPDTVLSKAYRRILPGWLTFHDGQDFSLVSSTLGIENGDQLKKLEKWLDDEKLLQVTDKVFRHRILKSVPSMDQDPDVELLKGVALSSCADVVATWFSSLVVERNGNLYVLRPLFDERKKKLAKQFLDYLVDMEVLKDPAISFPSANRERSREDIQQDLDGIKSGISSLNGFDMLAKLFYSKEETGKTREEEKSKSTLEQNITQLIPPIVPALVIFAVAGHFGEISSQRLQEAKAIKERRDKLSAALMQAVGIHLGQLKTLAKVKSSFCSLHDALPPAGDDQASPFDEVQQFNNQHLDRVLKVEEYVSRWNWRIGIVALIGVAQLVGAIAFPFFSAGLIGEGLNDLMFAFQSLQSPGSFSWKSYLVDKAKSLAVTALTMGLGAARLVKACGGSFRQAAKLMCRFNGTLKGWFQAGKKILIQCANMISSSVIGQAVSRFLTWLNKFIMEQVLERIKSFLFNNFLMRPAFTQLKDLMKSLMIAIVKSGKSAGEASRKIKEVLDGAANQLKAGDWFTELRTNASSITSRMTGIFNGSSAGLSGLQGNYAGEYRSHASTGNTQGITASANAGTIEKAIQVGKTIVDYGQKAADVTKEINKFATKCESVKKLATHGVTYVGDLNAALQDELRALKTKNKQGQQSAVGESTGGGLSKTEAERFEKFISDTEGEIQSSIMKETLDTIQSTWLEPKIQLKVERKVKSISSKFVKKYCPSLLPEGANDLKDNNNTNNGVGDGQMPTEDQWIDEMGNGRPAGPIEMQNSVDAYGFVLELEDKTGQYTQGDKFYYYPEGNPHSDKPVVKMSFTQNDDGTKHVCLIMPDGTKHEYVPDPSEPPNRCFFNALSKAQKDPSVDHTIEKLKNHAKGNDRARFMSKLGVNQSYQHLQAGAYSKIRNGNTIYEVDKLGRTVKIITTETKRQQERNSKKMKEIKEELGFQDRDVYSHDVSLNSGGVDEVYNISRMTHECNRYLYREHEENFEMFRDYNKQNGSPEVITRVITKHYEHSVGKILRMKKEGKYADRYKTKGYQHDFYTGPLKQPTNQYKSGFIPNWNGQQASIFHARNKDSRKMKKTNARRKATNVPIVRGPEFKKFFANIRKH